MEWLSYVFQRIGAAVCHQIPERTLTAAGYYLPVCARCTGIYLGITVSVLYFIIRKRFYRGQPPNIATTICAAFSFFFFMIDGGGSYLGLWQTNQWIRIVSGAFAGYALPIFFLLLLNFDSPSRQEKPVIENVKELLLLLFLAVGVCMILYFHLLDWYVLWSLGICFGIFFLFSSVFAVLFQNILHLKSLIKAYGLGFIPAVCLIGSIPVILA